MDSHRGVGVEQLRPTSAERDTSPGRQAPPVLYVLEDDVATFELLRDVAADAGWDVRGFTRLAPLRSALAHDKPTLLVLDDDLPDGRGGDLARDLRDDPRLSDVTVLVCTAAHPRRQAEINAWAPVVSKPFELGEIERFFDAAWRRHQRNVPGLAG
jgi:two-component system OmpR family response regulator